MANRRIVKRVLKNLDIEKIHKYMVDTNWKWVKDGSVYELEIPSVERIRSFVEDYTIQILDSKEEHTTMCSGGFWFIKHGKDCISVVFALASFADW